MTTNYVVVKSYKLIKIKRIKSHYRKHYSEVIVIRYRGYSTNTFALRNQLLQSLKIPAEEGEGLKLSIGSSMTRTF